MSDIFGDRMKLYEGAETQRRFIPLLPVIVRLDGKCFSKLTRHMERPFDIGMSYVMQQLTVELVKHTNALIGYTQSDEISLVLYSDSIDSQIYFDGKIFKILSILAGYTSAMFNRLANKHLLSTNGKLGIFDCRAWQVPNKEEATNAILWREIDATKNSVSMLAREYYSHKELNNKGRADMQEMLHAKGVNWNDSPPHFKRGCYVQRRITEKAFTEQELSQLPPKHDAHKNPNMVIRRSQIQILDMPPFNKVINRVEVIFDGADPMPNTKQEE